MKYPVTQDGEDWREATVEELIALHDAGEDCMVQLDAMQLVSLRTFIQLRQTKEKPVPWRAAE